MKSYRVNWDIDVDAKNPKDAAKQALAIQRDPQSTATSFEVYEQDLSRGHLGDGLKSLVDLKNPKLTPSPMSRFTALCKCLKSRAGYTTTIGFDIDGDAAIYIQKGLHYLDEEQLQKITGALEDVLNGDDK